MSCNSGSCGGAGGGGYYGGMGACGGGAGENAACYVQCDQAAGASPNPPIVGLPEVPVHMRSMPWLCPVGEAAPVDQEPSDVGFQAQQNGLLQRLGQGHIQDLDETSSGDTEMEEVRVTRDFAHRVLGSHKRTSPALAANCAPWRTPFMLPPEETPTLKNRSLDYNAKPEAEWPAAGEPAMKAAPAVMATPTRSDGGIWASPVAQWPATPHYDEMRYRTPREVAPNENFIFPTLSPSDKSSMRNTAAGEQIPPQFRSHDSYIENCNMNTDNQKEMSICKNYDSETYNLDHADSGARSMWIYCTTTDTHKFPQPTLASSRVLGREKVTQSKIWPYGSPFYSVENTNTVHATTSLMDSSQSEPSKDLGLHIPTRDFSFPLPSHLSPGGDATEVCRDAAWDAEWRRGKIREGEERTRQCHRLSSFRRVTELPKIVEFTEESSVDSGSTDSIAASKDSKRSKEQIVEEKSVIIRYQKIDLKDHSLRNSSSCVTIETMSKDDRESRTLDTLSHASTDSKTNAQEDKTIDESEQTQLQPQPQTQNTVTPYIPEVNRIMENLETMLESHACNDRSSVASKSTSSQTVQEVIEEYGSSIGVSSAKEDNRASQNATENVKSTWKKKSDISLDSHPGSTESEESSVSKKSLCRKSSISSSSSKRKSGRRRTSLHCTCDQNFVYPCIVHSRFKGRTRSGSNIHDEQCGFKMLIPEWHILHTSCVCQKRSH